MSSQKKHKKHKHKKHKKRKIIHDDSDGFTAEAPEGERKKTFKVKVKKEDERRYISVK